MIETIHFHTDLYRRDALEFAAEKNQAHVRVELADAGAHVVAHLEVLAADGDARLVRDQFCNDAFSATAQRIRDLTGGRSRAAQPRTAASAEPPWPLLAPFSEGAALGLGWVLESLSPVRSGAATMVLRHDQYGSARVAIRRNDGAPLGVAHTEHLDFMLMNGGSGSTMTEQSIGRVLIGLASRLHNDGESRDELLAILMPHAEARAAHQPTAGNGTAAAGDAAPAVEPRIDVGERSIWFDFNEAGTSRLALYDAVLPLADRCYVFLARPGTDRIEVRLKARGDASADGLAVLAQEAATALGTVARSGIDASRGGGNGSLGLPKLPPTQRDIDAVLAELVAADPETLGLGYEPERGPGHENLRIMTILGTGACNSDCLFCCEKFNPGNRLMPSADKTRQMILESAGEFDMLFFASGEPTIHPKLFQYVELAKSVGMISFGMSSHFRTFADPHFALKTLQAGFEYFDISLHAADAVSQLDVNPIDDGGASLFEALKGLAVIYRLAEALSIRVSVTHKIVVSRLNVTRLEQIFRATYDRGVRHFILQPVRTMGLSPDRQAAMAISEDEIIPHLNEFLLETKDLGAVIKPYGFARRHLIAGDHVEYERNRIKNVLGNRKIPRGKLGLPADQEERPRDGRHWIEVQSPSSSERFGFSSDGTGPILDDGLHRGVDLPFGCRMGSCGMCSALLLDGRVDQSTQHFLSDEQVRQGYVLLCQARPLSDVTVRMCTDDEIDPL
jgi:ferredoxin